MSTAARLWLLLAAFYASAHSILFVLVWRTVDLRLEIIVHYIAIPFLQASGLAWVAGGFNLRNCVRAVQQVFSHPVVAVLWGAQGVLLFLYWGPGSGAGLTEMVARTAGLEALLAVILILIRVIPGTGFRTWMAILPFAMVVLALGFNGISPWFSFLPLWLPDGWPLLLRQMVVLGVTVASVTAFAGNAQGALSERSQVSGIFLGWMLLFFVAAAMALIVNGYLLDFLVFPWREIITAFLSLAATSLFTAALCLCLRQNASQANMPSANGQVLKRYPSFLVMWAVLFICAIAATIMLRIFFPHRDFSLKVLLPMALIPLVQTSWLRWSHALGTGWMLALRLVKGQPFLSSILLAEVILFCAIAFPLGLWGDPAFGAWVAIWIGLKLVMLATGILKTTATHGLGRILRWIYGAGGVICGIAVACTGKVANAPWMIAALGSALILLAVGRLVHSATTARLAGVTAEACLVPILVMGFCTLLTRAYPLDPLHWVAYSLLAFSTTFLAMGLRENARKGS